MSKANAAPWPFGADVRCCEACGKGYSVSIRPGEPLKPSLCCDAPMIEPKPGACLSCNGRPTTAYRPIYRGPNRGIYCVRCRDTGKEPS